MIDSKIEKGEEISYTYDVLCWLNSLNSISGIIDNFKNTFHLENMSKFADKDTSYKEKVAYAKEASKTVATIYGGYKVGTSVQSLTDNLNIVTKQVPIGNIVNIDGTLSMAVTVPSISITNTAIINQALIEASVGNAMISTGGKNNRSHKDDHENDILDLSDQLLKDKKLTNSKKLLENYESSIKGYNYALKDFYKMEPDDIKIYENGTMVGKIKNVRNTSRSGYLAVEIYDSKTGKGVKIRY